MRLCVLWVALVSLLLVVASAALARKSSESTGRDSIEGELTEVKDAKAWLKKADGKVVGARTADLSGADRNYLESLAKKDPDDAADPPLAEEEPQRLIPSGPDAYTIHDYKKTALPFFEKVLVEAYRKHGKRDPKWDEQAEEFLREWAQAFIGAPDCLRSVDLLDRASAPLKLGCDDPLIRGLHIPLLTRLRGQYAQRELIEAFLVDTKEMGYPALTRLLLADASVATIKTYGYKGLAERCDEVILEGVREIVSEKPEKQSDCRPIFAILVAAVSSRDKESLEQVDEVCRKALEEGDGDAWLIHTLRGRTNITLAWAHRGEGWASEVDEEGWKGFYAHLAIAEKHLRLAHKLHPDRPEAAAMMITIVGAGGGPKDESILYWFRESVKAQMDYAPAYNKAYQFMQPKWGGSRAVMRAFDMECLRTKRYDTRVPMRFYTAMYKLGVQGKPRFALWRQPEIESLLDEVLDGYVKAPQFARQRNTMLLRQAMVARCCGRYSDALALLQRFEDGQEFNLTELQTHYIGRKSMVQELHARGGPAGSLVARADDVYASGDLAKARGLLQKALENVGDDPPGKVYLNGRLAGLEVEAELQTGDWIDMTFDKDLTGWWIERGRAEQVNEKTVRGWPGLMHFQFSMLHFANLGHRFQFEADAEIPDKRSDYDTTLIFCHAQDPLYRFRTFILFPQGGKAALRRDFVFGDIFPVKTYPDKNRMQVTVWDREVALAVDGEVIHRGTWLRPDEPFGTVESVGLGSWNESPKYRMTYSNLRVRGLKERPQLLDE